MSSRRRSAVAWFAGLAAVVPFALSVPEARAASDEVGIGGYHQEVLREAHRSLVAGDEGDFAVGGVAIRLGDERSGVTSSFTPRVNGFGLSGSASRDVDFGSLLKQSLTGSPADETVRRGVRIGSDEAAKLAGLRVGWAARAEIEAPESDGLNDESTFMVGGELAVSGVRLDAGYGQDPGLLGLYGERMTAGLAYGFGPVDARVGYSLIEDELAAETSLFTLGSQLAVRPGLVVQGDLAYAQDEEGNPATAGLVSLRLNF